MFIETLLERADRAERQLLLLSSHTHHNHYTHRNDKHTHPDVYADPYTPLPGRGGRSLDGSTDDIIANKMQGTFGNRVRRKLVMIWFGKWLAVMWNILYLYSFSSCVLPVISFPSRPCSSSSSSSSSRGVTAFQAPTNWESSCTATITTGNTSNKPDYWETVGANLYCMNNCS